MIEQIKTFYTLKPYFLHEKIDLVKKGASRRRSNLLLIDWLLTLNLPTIKISRLKLAYKLRLDSYIQARQKTRIDSYLSEAIAIAKELDFISNGKKDDNDVYEFTLNPEQCSRIKKATPPSPEEIDVKELESLSLPEERF